MTPREMKRIHFYDHPGSDLSLELTILEIAFLGNPVIGHLAYHRISMTILNVLRPSFFGSTSVEEKFQSFDEFQGPSTKIVEFLLGS